MVIVINYKIKKERKYYLSYNINNLNLKLIFIMSWAKLNQWFHQ